MGSSGAIDEAPFREWLPDGLSGGRVIETNNKGERV
jgi:hypothetical protein